jgi:NADPH:quinone reductase-like Zn-dependent oxidoreductase
MLQLQVIATEPHIALAFAKVSRSEPAARQVLIKTAAGVNPADWRFAGASGLPHPMGLDVAGTIVALGDEVDSFAIGDRVAGQAPMGAGTVAPYTVVRRTAIAPLPASVTFERGATLGTAGQVAWAAVIEQATLEAGQVVLIHGAGAPLAASRCRLRGMSEPRSLPRHRHATPRCSRPSASAATSTIRKSASRIRSSRSMSSLIR